jgi:hypothetical protein
MVCTFGSAVTVADGVGGQLCIPEGDIVGAVCMEFGDRTCAHWVEIGKLSVMLLWLLLRTKVAHC